MDRRRFLKTAAIGSIGLTVPSPDPFGAVSPPDLAVVRGLSAEKIVRAAVEALGGILMFIGAVLLFANKVPLLGKLPGDFLIRRGTFTFYFPLATSILISLLISLVLSLMGKFR